MGRRACAPHARDPTSTKMIASETPELPPARSTPDELSLRAHRRWIGGLGLALPLLLYVLSGTRPTEGLARWKPLESLSAYYYSGAVSAFAGVLVALALFLITYRGYKEVNADRIVGGIGGAAALLVALCPTYAPKPLLPASWWCEALGEIHLVAAPALFLCFILFSLWLFRKSNVADKRRRPTEKRIRDAISLSCGLVMIVAVLWAGSSYFTKAPIFWPESIAVWGFAISWLTKAVGSREPSSSSAVDPA
jgi:peptidoglycan/LPS O-acetylase OafA/YrhL